MSELPALLTLVGGIALVVLGAELFFDGVLALDALLGVSAFVLTAVISGFELENLAAGIAAKRPWSERRGGGHLPGRHDLPGARRRRDRRSGSADPRAPPAGGARLDRCLSAATGGARRGRSPVAARGRAAGGLVRRCHRRAGALRALAARGRDGAGLATAAAPDRRLGPSHRRR